MVPDGLNGPACALSSTHRIEIYLHAGGMESVAKISQQNEMHCMFGVQWRILFSIGISRSFKNRNITWEYSRTISILNGDRSASEYFV